jgi:hypothetical protein
MGSGCPRIRPGRDDPMDFSVDLGLGVDKDCIFQLVAKVSQFQTRLDPKMRPGPSR